MIANPNKPTEKLAKPQLEVRGDIQVVNGIVGQTYQPKSPSVPSGFQVVTVQVQVNGQTKSIDVLAAGQPY
jgi:hypothetical protein